MKCLERFFSRKSQGKKSQDKKERLPIPQRVAFIFGHVLNDLVGNTWFSYLIIFLTRIAGLPSAYAGYVLLISQVFEGVCTPLTGILCDRTVSRYGRRKLWHLLGSICVSLAFPFIYNRCIGCSDSSSTTKVFYYIGFAMVFGFGWGATQIGHLSLIPEICKRESERVELVAGRSAVTFLCGIFVYGVTWILLGQSSEQTLNPGVWKQFMYLALIIVGVGTFFNVVFHMCIKEPPCEALVEREKNKKKRKKENLKRRKSDNKALLEVSCKLSSPSRRSGASPDIVTTICKKTSKTEHAHCNGTVPFAPAPEGEGPNNETKDDVTRKLVDKDQIIGGGRTWRHWLKEPGFYKVATVYMCSRLVVNVSQSYLPLYLTETLKFEKEAIAYFPLVVLVSGVVASAIVKPLNKRLGSKITFCLGAILSISACFWFFVQTVSGRNAVYATAVLMGCGGSVMLVTSLALISELIAYDKTAGAFVYGSISFADKLSSGIMIAIIQQLNPRTSSTATCSKCEDFLRYVQSFAPGSSAVVALLAVVFFFDSAFFCKKRVETSEIGIQTNMDDDTSEDGAISFPVANGDVTHSLLRNGDVTHDIMIEVNKPQSEGEDSEDDNDIERDVENSSFVTRNFRRPKSRTFDDYAAMRLASPFLPSPVLERRTIL